MRVDKQTRLPFRDEAWAHRTSTPQVHDVDVGAQADVIGEVPAVVVGIEIKHDVVVVPQPVVGILALEWRDLEEKAADVEAIVVAALKSPDVLRADGAREASV